MMPPTPASFLNLDLEIDAPFDLVPLARHVEGQVFVLYCGSTESGFRLSLEPLIKGGLNAEPLACTEHLLAILESLPPPLRKLWSACESRVFDYGFDGGVEMPPIHLDLPAALLARAVSLGLDLRITIYPCRAEE